jgi:hypothetical protein
VIANHSSKPVKMILITCIYSGYEGNMCSQDIWKNSDMEENNTSSEILPLSPVIQVISFFLSISQILAVLKWNKESLAYKANALPLSYSPKVTLELKDADSFCRVAERCNRKSLQ